MSKLFPFQKNYSWKDWNVQLEHEDVILNDVIQSMKQVSHTDVETPFIVKLLENPKYEIPGFTIFNGAVTIEDHDCIHALLGRGLLSKDEAFVIGFTMGSSNRVTTLEERMFTFATKYLYPDAYKFDDSDIEVFKAAVHLGYISQCQPLNDVDFKSLLELSLKEARQAIKLEVDLLKAYYRIEQQRFPDALDSQRLLDNQ